jgi:uncharacterized membrane protein
MSQKTFRSLFIFIVVVGIVDGTYLSILKLTGSEAMCIKGMGDCATVNSSAYSQVYGIPIAVLGALAYLSLLVLILLDGRTPFWKTYTPYFLFGITLVGTLYSAYLTYLELEIIRAICPFCVLSAISMLILFGLSIYHLVSAQAESNA